MQPNNWYAGLYDAAGANPAYYHGRAVNPVTGYNNQVMQHMSSSQEMGASYQVQPYAHAQTHAQVMTPAADYHGYDEGVPVRPWRRATMSHYTPEFVPGVVRVDRQGRQRKAVPDRKRKEAEETLSMTQHLQHHQHQHHPEQQHLQSIQQSMHPAYQPQHQHQQQHPPQHPQFIAAGHPHPIMPHEMYAYAGHEQLIHRPLGH